MSLETPKCLLSLHGPKDRTDRMLKRKKKEPVQPVTIEVCKVNPEAIGVTACTVLCVEFETLFLSAALASDLVPCPICNHTFTNSALNQHLDKGCEPGGSEPSALERGLLPVAGSGNGAKPKLDSWFNRSKGGGGAASSSKKTAPSSPSGTSKFGKT